MSQPTATEDVSKQVDCSTDPIGSLVQMFVGMVQQGRIARGQCPALRPVFLKPHGVVQGSFRVRADLPSELKVGLFAGSEYPAWVRFSSDTLPTVGDYTTTLGIAIKLFDTPTPKIFGQPEETTFDFILQNMDVFFVDTARDMCQFTKAGVVDGNYQPYLDAHPKTAKILDAMAKPVGSVLASPYWSGVPFSFGPERYVKYKLEPTLDVPAPKQAPADPTYLAADLSERLKRGPVSFRFCIQLRTNPETMPLDQATVAWPESESPNIHVADLVLSQQDISARGQASYGENLSWNIWRVTEAHRPQGSIAEARRVVYQASAQERRNTNGIPDGEPAHPKPVVTPAPCVDDVIVRAAIHPAIGVARVGDALTEFYVGPEVTEPAPRAPNEYRDAAGALKREAARFRVYGYNAAGQVVRELTSQNAAITWSVELANTKAAWFRFITALDIPESATLEVPRRNAAIKGAERASLCIEPGVRSISGASVAGGAEYAFDTGKFKKKTVPLGELQTDAAGRLLVLGGRGKSASPSGAPPYSPDDPDTFNNADDWYDDVADGPVTASVSIAGRQLAVEGAWVLVAPPNYAPDVIGWRTLYDLLTDVYVGCGWLPMPDVTSFSQDVLPQLQRLSNLQWVNQGFATMFGAGGPMDFTNPRFVAKLAAAPNHETGDDPYAQLRQQMLNAFRPNDGTINDPRLWPWLYGDDFSADLFGASPRIMLELPAVQQVHLQRWVAGKFVADWDPAATPPRTLEQVPLAAQPAMLDKAALHFCLADAFHPGCEVTWPIRHATMFERPFRIRHAPRATPAPDYGATLNQRAALSPTGPLHAQRAGDLTRWMGLPWQGDTAYCRSGYDPDFDPYLPSFWPARVPNTVLTEADYQLVIDASQPREARIAAFNRRASWYRFIDQAPSIPARMERMIAHFGAQGIVEARPGVVDDPDFPAVIYVETLPPARVQALRGAAKLAVERGLPASRLEQAGWGDAEHLAEARRMRSRRKK